jgi:transposase
MVEAAMGWRSGQSYSQDLRDRVLAAVDSGMAVRRVAPMFVVSVAYIYKALIRRRLTGDSGPNPTRGHRLRKLSPDQEQALAAHIRSRPGITLAQVQAWLLAEHGVELSTGAVWNAVQRLGLSFKKSPARGRAGPTRRRGPPHAVARRAAVHRS